MESFNASRMLQTRIRFALFYRYFKPPLKKFFMLPIPLSVSLCLARLKKGRAFF
jgi:hypothetical protein